MISRILGFRFGSSMHPMVGYQNHAYIFASICWIEYGPKSGLPYMHVSYNTIEMHTIEGQPQAYRNISRQRLEAFDLNKFDYAYLPTRCVRLYLGQH